MSENKNIDRLFQESFKDFEVDAPKGSWQNIEKRLVQKNRKRIIPMWQKIGAAAAIVSVLILAGSQWFISPNPNNSFVVSPNESVEDVDNQNGLTDSNSINPNIQTTNSNSVVNTNEIENSINQLDERPENSSTSSSNNSNSVVNNIENNDNSNQQIANVSNDNNLLTPSTAQNNSLSEDYSVLISGLNSKTLIQNKSLDLKAKKIKVQNNKFSQPKLKSLVEVAEQINNEKFVSKNKEENSWFVKPQVSPVFYGNLGSGSAIDQNFNQNSGQGEVNMSYGLNVAYKLNDKIKIRTGINRVNLNYNTNDVFLLPISGFSSINNVDVASSFESSVVTSAQLSTLGDSGFSGRIPTDESQLQQQLGFIEIPMELEYKLIDKTIDVNIIGGASTLLLNNNSLDIQSGNNTSFLGEANNVNNLSFSTNFAIGLDYDISDKLILNLEPTFKYQFNTFQSGTTDFQPFFIGVYSGVVFKF
jgi:hypothetical protein